MTQRSLGLSILAFFALMSLISLVWLPGESYRLDLANRLQPPGGANLLGTDHLGRDLLSMIMIGARASIAVAGCAVALGAGIGVPAGLWAATGGRHDRALGFLASLIFAFPAVISAVMIAATLGAGTLTAILAIGVFNVPVFFRQTRNLARNQWQRGYVLAAIASGKSTSTINLHHILPGIQHVIRVQIAIQLSLAVLAEAGLSFLGLGPAPPSPSWGRMIAEAQTFHAEAPHTAIVPGIAILLLVYGFSLAAER